MLRLIATAGFALSVAVSAQAMTPAPIAQPDSMITEIAAACRRRQDSRQRCMCRKNHRSSDPASRLQKCERDNLLAGRSRNPAVEAMVILTHPDRWLGSETRKDSLR